MMWCGVEQRGLTVNRIDWLLLIDIVENGHIARAAVLILQLSGLGGW